MDTINANLVRHTHPHNSNNTHTHTHTYIHTHTHTKVTLYFRRENLSTGALEFVPPVPEVPPDVGLSRLTEVGASSSKLPGWVKFESESGDYYWNPVTQVTKWASDLATSNDLGHGSVAVVATPDDPKNEGHPSHAAQMWDV